MVKKMKFLLIILIMVLGFNIEVEAACSAEDEVKFSTEAMNVKVSYELAREELPKDSYDPPEGLTGEELENFKMYIKYFNVIVNNLTENIYVDVYEKKTNKITRFKYENSDNGTVKLRWDNLRVIGDFTVTVYTSDNTNCGGKKLFSIPFTTPRYNEYSEYNACKDNPNYYLCQEYLTFEPTEDEDVLGLIYAFDAQQKNEKNKKSEVGNKGLKGFLGKNKWTITIVTAIVVVGGGITILVLIKRRKKNSGEHDEQEN